VDGELLPKEKSGGVREGKGQLLVGRREIFALPGSESERVLVERMVTINVY
jgi:hypothetical protein